MTLLWLYMAGVLVGLAIMRDPLPVRLVTALLWPLGPAASVFVVTLLLIVAILVWPVTMLALAALVAAAVWLLL